MAAAEARAAWQRTANRCFVQEDAKRAPRLACCPSSSSKLQSDASGDDLHNGSDFTATNIMPLNWNSSYSSLPPDTKWLLQLQSNYACSKDFTREQLNAVDPKVGEMADDVNEASLPCKDSQDKSPSLSSESHCGVSARCVKYDSEARVQELKAVTNMQHSPKHKGDKGDFWCSYEEFMDARPVNMETGKKDSSDFDMPWVEEDKMEPWWRTADRHQLASLVARKSSEHIENCDLPPPQPAHIRKGPYAHLESFDHCVLLPLSVERYGHADFCNQVDNMQHGLPSGSMDGKNWPPSESRCTCYHSGPFSETISGVTTVKDSLESKHSSESFPCKAQLLEALRHSQTRAREAEEAAKQANTEKEHIIKLFLKQASHLFAYKQWLHLLQLETLVLQLKAKDNQKTSSFLPGLPWRPLNVKRLRKGVQKMIHSKGDCKTYGFCKYAFTVAVGLGLAGAGLLLGWSMGWLLRAF